MAFNHVLTLPTYRSRRADSVCMSLFKKVLSASRYGRTKVCIEFWSQCHIFRFGNIAYCCEIDIFIDENIAYCCQIDIFLTKTLLLVARLTYSWPKRCLLLRDWHFEAKKGSPGLLFWFPQVFTDPAGVPPGFHPGSTGVFGRWLGLYRGGFGRYLVEVRVP